MIISECKAFVSSRVYLPDFLLLLFLAFLKNRFVFCDEKYLITMRAFAFGRIVSLARVK